MNLRKVTVVSLAVVSLVLGGCASPYDKRMKYLDEMSSKGIEYRGQLQKQGTAPSQAACETGFKLLKADPPWDEDGWNSDDWKAEVQEAYVKSCLTGGARPKPDPSGIKAVTPVPFNTPSPS